MRICFFLAACAAMVAWVGCASSARIAAEPPVEPQPAPVEVFNSAMSGARAAVEADLDYRVGPRDVISIVVYGEEDLSVEQMMITSEGFISMPLIGKVQVDHMTVTEIEWKISELLADGFLLNPQVMVTVQSFMSRKAIILGAVVSPGSYPLKGRFLLLDLISQAGGISSQSAGSNILIWREQNSKHTEGQMIRIETERLLNQGDMRLNVSIMDRDVVFLPEAEFVYIIGEVQSPGSFRLQRDGITAIEAISMAGGFTDIASSNKTRIVRSTDGEEQTISVPVRDVMKGERSKDVVLMPGDIIVVPQSLF